MSTASQRLAQFACDLRLDDVPPDVVRRAKVCIADTVACGIHGAAFRWSEQVAAYARRYGAGGPCRLFAGGAGGVQAPLAALANAAAVHAFEQDSLRFPGAGVHPGAALVPVIAAVCEETGAGGAAALRAFVAACEVLFRIGAATHHSSEKLGFHAPGLTGVYGATVAAGLLYGLAPGALAGAMGTAGSLSAGLLAFSKSSQGAEVKRLHMGRACEAGILAARLAQSGFVGPESVLEGRFGFLEVYCRDGDAALLTAALGQAWETRRICLKRYACHVTAQAPVQALRAMLSDHRLRPRDVAAIEIASSPKVLSHHDIRQPQDVMQAQYSVPFCVALALHRDPLDPSSFDESALHDPAIAATCAAIRLVAAPDLPTAWSARLTVTLRDGSQLQCDAPSFKGMPGQELTPAEEQARFQRLCTGRASAAAAAALYARFETLEQQASFPALPEG